MPQLETFSTAELPPHRRLEYWNDLTGSAFTPLVTDPVDRRAFAGRLTRTQVGGIRLAEARSEPAIVRHSRQHVARTRHVLPGVTDDRGLGAGLGEADSANLGPGQAAGERT